ncbi:uncharacterized protein SOCE26_013180 [Sorangium cellulosum]|uniref:Uncharacterized protein n=1 Tax=Sorangium cellulosum TaxID=56 RepID=A0A2L0EKV2_SORCE|nr:PD40 domain-containing protein [Sorangium cellulosum]AUX39923.1 uncharacterized protein SOCE26_013180 [Sorangium cellulosum]
MKRRLPGIVAVWGSLLALGGAGCEDQHVVIGVTAPGQGGGGGSGGGAGGAAGAPELPAFEAPTAVTEINSDAREEDPTLTGDLLEIYFMSDRDGDRDIWTSRREALGSPWDPPHAVENINQAGIAEDTPSVSDAGLRLWFYSAREPAGIWRAERASRDEPWGAPVHVDTLAVPETEVMSPHVDSSELHVAVGLRGPSTAGWDLAIATRERPDDDWGALAPLSELNGPDDEHAPFLFDDRRQILFRSGGDLLWARRPRADAAFEQAAPLAEPVNLSDARDTDPYLSPDGSVLFFASTRSGVADIYEARRAAP